MKTDILVKIVSAALLMAHSTTSKTTSKVTATSTSTTSTTTTTTATASHEARSSLHRHGKKLYICGGYLNPEDISAALEGLSSISEPRESHFRNFLPGDTPIK